MGKSRDVDNNSVARDYKFPFIRSVAATLRVTRERTEFFLAFRTNPRAPSALKDENIFSS